MLHCAVLKHLRQESYRGLEFALRDSLSAQRFARVDAARLPGKSALQATIGSIRAGTWERINRHLLGAARDERVETGDQVRVDSTATETHILEPSDSRLLYDGVRVMTRLLRAAGTPWARAWAETAAEYGDLLARVVDRTNRRVFRGETVPAAEKVVSLFEPHTDIIRKGGRDTYYGHKVNFATGHSGLVLDAVVEDGNPADSARCLPMLERHVEHYGAAPSRAAFDGGYASRGNLDAAKELGVAHVVFHKKRGMKVADMTPSSWLYARLKRFRAGIEAGISYLKRWLRPRPVPLAGPGTLQGLRAVGGVRPQPDAPRPAATAADLTRRPPPVAKHRFARTGGRPLPVRAKTVGTRPCSTTTDGRHGPSPRPALDHAHRTSRWAAATNPIALRDLQLMAPAALTSGPNTNRPSPVFPD